jgi:hypothetical protein
MLKFSIIFFIFTKNFFFGKENKESFNILHEIYFSFQHGIFKNKIIISEMLNYYFISFYFILTNSRTLATTFFQIIWTEVSDFQVQI